MLHKLLAIVVIAVLASGLLVTGVYGGLKYSRQIDYRFFPDQSSFFETDGPTYKDYSFDKTYVLPETSVTIAYPSKGFYGWGVTRSDEVRSEDAPDPGTYYFWLTSPAHHPERDPLMSVSISVKQVSSRQTLQDVVKEEARYSPEEIAHGSLVTLNNHDYWIWKRSVNPLDTHWFAVTMGKKEAISIHFFYQTGRSLIANKAYRNNDQLFFEILSHINFD